MPSQGAIGKAEKTFLWRKSKRKLVFGISFKSKGSFFWKSQPVQKNLQRLGYRVENSRKTGHCFVHIQNFIKLEEADK